MKKNKKYTSILFTLGAFICFLFVSTSIASVAVSVNKKDSNLETIQMDSEVVELIKSGSQEKARAPEPTTLFLFGGGIFGMMAGFLRQTYQITKRIFDITFSVLLLLIASPVMILTAILVKLTSKGPMLYSQTRVGLNGRNFEIYKFRTMKVDAEKESGPVWAKKNDNRITPIGQFLRKSRLDELPQLFNVLKGEMSVIGPRPERPMFVDQFKISIENYEQRLTVKPGITGLAQVFHTYDEDIEGVRKKLEYDLQYIKNMDMWADLKIVFRTVTVVLTGFGAR